MSLLRTILRLLMVILVSSFTAGIALFGMLAVTFRLTYRNFGGWFTHGFGAGLLICGIIGLPLLAFFVTAKLISKDIFRNK